MHYDWQTAEDLAEIAHLSGLEEEKFFGIALEFICRKYWKPRAKPARRLFMRHCVRAYRRNREHNSHSFNLWEKDEYKERRQKTYKTFIESNFKK